MSDTRQIYSIGPSSEYPGHFNLALSDGTNAVSQDFIDSPEGIRVEIKGPDGGPSGDGPLLTDAIRVEFEKFGTQNIPSHSSGPASFTAPAPAAATQPIPSSGPMIPVPTPAVAAAQPQHAHLAGILHGACSFLEHVIGYASNPAVMALLPAKYQGYATAALVVEQIAGGAAGQPGDHR